MLQDEMSPAQARRFELWRALNDLARAHDEGRLTPEQVDLFRSLVDSLQQLADQLSLLAELGLAWARILDQLPPRPPTE
jgi:hypothetical protein